MLTVALRRWRFPRVPAATFVLCLFPVLPGLAVEPRAAGTPAGSRAGLVSFQRIVIPDDVPAHLVTALAQDRAGFLWIGTQGGLVRHDGYGFRVYRADPGRSDAASGMAGSYVRALHAARDGRIWIGAFSGGLSVYDPASETFTRYQHDPEDPASLANNRIEGLAEDAAGRIWIATGEGLDRLDPKSGRVEHFRHDPADPRSLAHDRVRGLLVDRAGRLWVGTRDGLQVRRGEAGGFERVARPLAGELVAKLYEDRRGRIWIGTTEHGGAVLDPRTGELRRLPPLRHFWVYGFAEATAGEVWVATFGGGIDVVDLDTLAVVESLRHDPTLESTIGGDRIGAILRDRSGVVWAGTWGQGLARHDPAARAFRALRHSPSRPEGLSHPSAVRALERQDGTVWVGTNGNGIDVLDRGLRRIGGHSPDPESPAALSDGSVTCLAEASDGTVWVATLDGVLHRRAPGTDRFERFTEKDGLPGGAIRALTFTPDGALWAGSAQGLARLDPGTGRITAFRHDPGDPASLSGSAVEAIAAAPDGTLWVGTDNGLNAFDPSSGTAVRVRRRPGERDSLPDDWIPDLMMASDGRLWVGTAGGAAVLDSWDGRTARFLQVSEKIGRPPGPVEALVEDGDGQVWLGPRLRVDPRIWTSRELGPADGCAFRSFFIASRARRRDGSLLFGSPEGLLAVDPRALRPWTYAPPLVATGLRVGGRERPGAAALERLVLPPEERAFRLEFAALDLTAPERIAYRYRLEGFDEDWSTVDSAQRSLAYTRLPPGNYSLRVQGTNRAGVWSPHELRLPVEVTPAFHETAPFRAAALAVLAALLYGVYRLRVHRLRARGQELERLVDLRTGELANRNRELKVAYERIEEASLTDPLTGLRNRRYLEQVIAADVEMAVRRHEDGAGDRDLVFFLVDLDHFKSVNDTWGHVAGDAVLVATAEVLRSTFRASDHLVRWGGEEFLVVARFVNRNDAPKLAEKLRAAIESWPFEIPGGGPIRRTCSIGFASCPFSPAHPREVSWSEIVDAADCALYAAKRSGRNGWVGIEAEQARQPAEVVQRFRTAPAAAAESGEIRVSASAGATSELQWA